MAFFGYGLNVLALFHLAGASRIQIMSSLNRPNTQASELSDLQASVQKSSSLAESISQSNHNWQSHGTLQDLQSASLHSELDLTFKEELHMTTSIVPASQSNDRDTDSSSVTSVSVKKHDVDNGSVHSSGVQGDSLGDMIPMRKTQQDTAQNVTSGSSVRHLLSMLQTEMNLGGILGITAAPRLGPKVFVGAVLALFFCSCCLVFLSTGKRRRKRPRGRRQYVIKDRILYEWDQTPRTITIYTKPPGRILKDNIEVMVWPRHVHIGRKGNAPFLKEELFGIVNAEASSWCVSRKGELEICLHKVEEGEWPCVISAHRDADVATPGAMSWDSTGSAGSADDAGK